MSSKPKNKGLGRGLSALLADVDTTRAPTASADPSPRSIRPDQSVPIELVRPNPDQPRKVFRQADLDDLTASIREKGILQPLIVRPDPNSDGAYELVAGERRWRAAQAAGVHEVPVLVRELSDVEVLEVAIIENIQRADLNAIEEAAGYRQLMDSFGHTQERLAEALGKSRSHIANLLRLLTLPADVMELVESGKLSAGHARALITSPDPSALAKKVVSGGLSVRQTEKLAKSGYDEVKPKGTTYKVEKDADTRAIEADLSAALRMRVTIDQKPGTEGGKIQISYKDLDQLDQILQLLAQ